MMNFVLVVFLPPIAMFVGMSIVEKVLGRHLCNYQVGERNALVAIHSRIFAVIVLLILPSLNIGIEIVRTREISEWFTDYLLGVTLGINANTMIMHSLTSNGKMPVTHILVYAGLYYQVVMHSTLFVYNFMIVISFFSMLRIMDDVAVIFPYPSIVRTSKLLRYSEEVALYLMLVWSFFHWDTVGVSKFVVFPVVFLVAYMYSDIFENNDNLHMLSRKSTTLPSVKHTLKDYRMIADAGKPQNTKVVIEPID